MPHLPPNPRLTTGGDLTPLGADFYRQPLLDLSHIRNYCLNLNVYQTGREDHVYPTGGNRRSTRARYSSGLGVSIVGSEEMISRKEGIRNAYRSRADS